MRAYKIFYIWIGILWLKQTIYNKNKKKKIKKQPEVNANESNGEKKWTGNKLANASVAMLNNLNNSSGKRKTDKQANRKQQRNEVDFIYDFSMNDMKLSHTRQDSVGIA